MSRYYIVRSADGLEGVFGTLTDATGYLFELRGIGVPGLRIDEAESLRAYCQQLDAAEREPDGSNGDA